MHALQFVIDLRTQIAHQIPGCFMGKVIAEESEEYSGKIQYDKYCRKKSYASHACFIHATLHDSRHGGKDFRSGQVDCGEKQSGKNCDHI